MADYRLFGPRTTYTRPRTNLSMAREVTSAERRARTPSGPTFFGRTFMSHGDISRAGSNYPIGYAKKHGGRGLAEVRRDQLLNTLQQRRGMGPTAPMRHTNFFGDALRGAHRRVQSFMNRRF